MDPAAGAAGRLTGPDLGQAVPWEDPSRPRVVGFCRTLGQLLFHPEDFFENLGREGRAEPFAFGLIAGSTGLLGCFFWYILLGAAAVPGGFQVFPLGAMLGIVALAPAVILAKLLIGSLSLWAGSALMGAGRGFTTAWRICCYVQGGMVLALIPFFGAPLAAIWMLLLIYRGIEAVGKTGIGRTLAALLVFLVLQALIWAVLLGSAVGLMALGGFLIFLGGG
jgi:hypothetical protein